MATDNLQLDTSIKLKAQVDVIKPRKKSLKDPSELRSKKSVKVVVFDDRRKSFAQQINEEKALKEIDNEKKRKSSIYLLKNANMNKKKKSVELASSVISSMIEKSEKGTDYQKYKGKIKTYDIIIAILVFINIFVTICDNNVYISESNTYLQNYMVQNKITGISNY